MLCPAEGSSLASELGDMVSDAAFQVAYRALGLATTAWRDVWPTCGELAKSLQAVHVLVLDGVGVSGVWGDNTWGDSAWLRDYFYRRRVFFSGGGPTFGRIKAISVRAWARRNWAS